VRGRLNVFETMTYRIVSNGKEFRIQYFHRGWFKEEWKYVENLDYNIITFNTQAQAEWAIARWNQEDEVDEARRNKPFLPIKQ
jgi:hypothetical protein